MTVRPTRVSARLTYGEALIIREIAADLGLCRFSPNFTKVLRHLLEDWKRREEGDQ